MGNKKNGGFSYTFLCYTHFIIKYNSCKAIGDDKMSIFRVEKNKNYTIISNYHLRDKNLSLKAIGLLSLILSLPDNWDYSQAGLAAICKDGEDSIRSGLKELEKFGYLERERERDESGRVRGIIYRIFEVPKDFKETKQSDEQSTRLKSKKKPKKENSALDDPVLENPIQADPSGDKKAQINKDLSITDKQNKDLINLSINQTNTSINDRPIDDVTKRAALTKIIKQNVGYDFFAMKNQELIEKLTNNEIDLFTYDIEAGEYDIKILDSIIDAMLDVMMSLSNEPIKIGTELISRALVQAKLMHIDMFQMRAVVKELYGNRNIKNRKKYAISMLYNS